MYYWRIELLKGELSRDALPQRMAFQYVLGTMLAYAVLTGMPGAWNTDPTPPALADWVSYATVVLLTISGTYLSFRANGGDMGIDFASRYFAIGWVLMIRLVVLVGLPFLLAMLLIILPGTEPTEGEIAWLGAGTGVGFVAIYYWRLWRHIKNIATPSKSRV